MEHTIFFQFVLGLQSSKNFSGVKIGYATTVEFTSVGDLRSDVQFESVEIVALIEYVLGASAQIAEQRWRHFLEKTFPDLINYLPRSGIITFQGRRENEVPHTDSHSTTSQNFS